MIEKLCKLYGTLIGEVDGHSWYKFPSVTSLCDPGVETNLRNAGFGYRAKYIYKTALTLQEKGGEEYLYNLRSEPYQRVHTELTKLHGVGSKVSTPPYLPPKFLKTLWGVGVTAYSRER